LYLDLAALVGTLDQVCIIAYIYAGRCPYLPPSADDVDLADRLRPPYPFDKLEQCRFALPLIDLCSGPSVNIRLVANGEAPPADDRFGLHRPIQKEHHADHQNDRRQEPKKDL